MELLQPVLACITPKLAGTLLAQCAYPRQRAVRWWFVEQLEAELKRGALGRSQIQIAELGAQRFVVDGQHRLWAVLRSGVTWEFDLAVTRCDSMQEVDRLYTRIDRGKVRSKDDYLRAVDGYADLGMGKRQVQKAYGAAAVLITGFDNSNPSDDRIARLEDARYAVIREWAEWFIAYDDAVAGCPSEMYHSLAVRALHAVAVVTCRYQPEKARDFWRRVASVDGLTRYSGEGQLSRAILSGKMHWERKVLQPSRMVAKCWNAYYAGTTLQKLKVMDGELGKPILVAGTPYDGKKVVRCVPEGFEYLAGSDVPRAGSRPTKTPEEYLQELAA